MYCVAREDNHEGGIGEFVWKNYVLHYPDISLEIFRGSTRKLRVIFCRAPIASDILCRYHHAKMSALSGRVGLLFHCSTFFSSLSSDVGPPSVIVHLSNHIPPRANLRWD